ncbi:MAG: hypothetical protein U0Q18_05985 [Bryobacteraceae bacterium]
MAETSRREFLYGCVLAGSSAMALPPYLPLGMLIETAADASFRRRLAERELLRGLTALRLPGEIQFCEPGQKPGDRNLVFRLRVAPDEFRNPESYSISHVDGLVTLQGASDSGLLHAVFDFLEHQGAYFGVDGEIYPIQPASHLILPSGEPWKGVPRFAVRGLLPWPDFLNCISVYNDEDFRAYFEGMLRMRFNTFGMHVYTGANQWAESYLSFEYGGVGHLSFLDTSASHRWGSIPERTSWFGMGAAQFFDRETFGADATRLSTDPWETAERTRAVLARSLTYAKKLGIATGVGFEPYQIPDEILRALPPEVKPPKGESLPGGARFDIESVAARRMLEARLGQLLEAYPDLDYVWLWEDENMNWESRKSGIPLSPTPFLQAYDFLRRNAPGKKMILSGWGGVVRHFEYFHRKLPQDVVFTSLNDSLGWDPVNEAYGKLEGRERWPIPWLEDDPGMWLPQYHVHRTQRDVELAASMGCQGMLGIHWRHRIMDATAGYLARAAWDRSWTPASHFQAYAGALSGGERATRLANVLTDADLKQKFLNTGTAETKDGHVVTREYAGDYDEGFLVWNNYEPEQKILDAQSETAKALREIADGPGSAIERERLEYVAGFVEFAVPYAEAWRTGHRLSLVLEAAGKLKSASNPEAARKLVRDEAVPLWVKLAPLVRETMLRFQAIVATRNDLGQLASMHNKFARLALVRMRMSMQEYLGELPSETEVQYRKTVEPDPAAEARLFVPTRPSVLKENECVRITIVATGSAPVKNVVLHTRGWVATEWAQTPAKLLGRRTYEAVVGPFEPRGALSAYYVSAVVGDVTCVAPPDGPRQPWLITLA